MKKVKFVTLAIALMFAFSFYSNGAASAMSLDQTDPYKIGIVYSTGGLGDQSFNDAAKRGIVDALDEYGDQIVVYQLCERDCSIPDITERIEQFAANPDPFDLIIGIGFSSADGITASATAHPDLNFMIIDAVVDLPNVDSIVFKEQEGSFLVGAMAAMVTNTDQLGFLGGLDIPLINRFGAGFEHGAKYINPDITVTVAYSPNPNNPWGDVAGGKTVAESFIEEGVDIIFAAAGGTGGGVFEAVADANANVEAGGDKYYAIGVDSDQDHISEGNILCSMIKKVDVAVYNEISKIVDGTWASGTESLGLAEDGVDISPMTYTQNVANGQYDGQTRIDKVDELKQMIIDGDIVVAETFDDVDAIDFGSTSSDEGFTPFPVFPAFLAIFSAIALIRRRNDI